MSLNLTSEPNEQLLKLFGNQQYADEVASQVYLLAVKLKKNKITKLTEPKPPQVTQPTTVFPQSNFVTRATPTVTIDFYHNTGYGKLFTFDVDTNKTVRQLIDEVAIKLREDYNLPVTRELMYKNATITGALAKYNFKDGDFILVIS